MPGTEISLQSTADGLLLRGYRWLPATPLKGASPKATLLLAHGMAEHAGRYARFAAALNDAGYAVYAFDHRGHGLTAEGHGLTAGANAGQELGHAAPRDGWNRMVADLVQAAEFALQEQPGKPLLLFGHSMGSFMAQRFIELQGGLLRGCVLCASNGKPPAIAVLGKLIARLERLRCGPRGTSKVIDAMGFGAFNKHFAPNRTEYDWLSRDTAEVDTYIADPLCGFSLDTQFWIDFLDGLDELSQPAEQARIPQTLPLLVIAGTRDPVSAGTRGLRQLLDAYKAAGLSRVEHIFYDDARHELLNETNRAQVSADIIGFLDRCL